jgi:ribosomal protein S27AE
MQKSELSSIEAAVNGGMAVVSADDSIIIAMMHEALKNGRSATFYVSPAQAQAVMRLYYTPRRVKEIGMEAVSKEERDRIESELGVKDMGPMFSNRIQCGQCGGIYGAFEFMEQGLRQHGRDWVGAVVALKNAAVLRINPTQDAFCSRCGDIIIISHWYGMYAPDGTLIYGCCSGPDVIA